MGISHRQLKRDVRKLLTQEDLETALAKICQMTPRKVVNPLFGLLNDREEMIRWRAVTAMGRVVSQLADANDRIQIEKCTLLLLKNIQEFDTLEY